MLVWIHGGAFLNGSGDVYNARSLTSRGDIVVVTINYRLGALGFLAHPALGPAGDVGNYGLADQQAALRWVRDNIAGFGGDPDKVTIAGESAGGMSVCDHLVAPGSAGLFQAAIMQSAPCQLQSTCRPRRRRAWNTRPRRGAPIRPRRRNACARCRRTSCSAPWCIGRIGTEVLSGPVTGTATLPVDPVAGFAEGRAARVPVLIGNTADEFNLFTALRYLNGRAMDAAQYPELLAEAFGPDAAAVAEHYPPDRFGGSVPLAYSAAMTDGDFACAADRIADALTKAEPVYAYEFNDRNAPAPEPFREAPFPVGASHSLELRYLFDMGGAPPLNPAQQRLSGADDRLLEPVRQHWVAECGGPAQLARPRQHRVGRANVVAAGRQSRHHHVRQAHQCPFWASLKARRW